jgi:CPA1 family monovalent cation:H+ antiporter
MNEAHPTAPPRASEIFAGLPAAELDELASALRLVEVELGADVVRADDHGAALYLVQEGEADVIGSEGEALRTLGRGDSFGEIALLLTGRWTATVAARTPMRLLSLSGQDFATIRTRVPALESALRRRALERASS